MFHAPTSETKQQSGRAQTQLQQGPHFSASPPFAPSYAPTRGGQSLAYLHSTYGNQAVLRMLSHSTPAIQAKLAINKPGDEFEQEADRVADQVMRMTNLAVVQRKCSACAEQDKLLRLPEPMVQRHKDDIVGYSGGQSGMLSVMGAGKLTFSAPAVSGHPGHGENEPGAGPIPTGTYLMHPQITNPSVDKVQDGICGAVGIGAGYQEITSNNPTPCSGAHYCNVPCPTTTNPSQVCFTPVDCWGPKRIRIQGSKTVVTPEGKKETRDGFFLHGGNPKDAVTSGCVKTLDNGAFAEVRKLNGVQGAVPFCVGTACPATVDFSSKAESSVPPDAGSSRVLQQGVDSH